MEQVIAGDGTHKTAESDFSAALGSRRIAAVTFRERIRKRREEKNKVQEKKEEEEKRETSEAKLHLLQVFDEPVRDTRQCVAPEMGCNVW